MFLAESLCGSERNSNQTESIDGDLYLLTVTGP